MWSWDLSVADALWLMFSMFVVSIVVVIVCASVFGLYACYAYRQEKLLRLAELNR